MLRSHSVPPFRYHFIFNWRMFLLTLLVVSLFLRLGFWQLHRADEKKIALAKSAYNAAQGPIPLDVKKTTNYQKVRVQGHYLEPVLLLDNQHYQHQFGYDVLSPLQLADNTVVFIDRGWIPGDVRRLVFPRIQKPQGLVELTGSVYFPSRNPWIEAVGAERKGKNTTIIEAFDVEWMNDFLQKRVHSFIIRLDKKEAYGFQRNWAIVSMPPHRHLGYALQWFAMALAVLIIFIVLHVKKNEEINY